MAASPINSGPLGYYVHHHGLGHMQRALSITRQLSRPVVMFSSQPEPTNLPANVTFIQLVSDIVEGYAQPKTGVFHYTPYSALTFRRNQQLIDAWQAYGIMHVYVDVSVEVALLAKLYGLTVGYALMTGVRTDEPHRYAYDAVDYLLAHRASEFAAATEYCPTATPVLYSGGIARLAKQAVRPLTESRLTEQGLPRIVAVSVSPKHEQDISQPLLACADHFTDTTWHLIGQSMTERRSNIVSHGMVSDPQTIYEQSDIIIGSGGTNTIMEAASMGIPFICIPEPRPFDEQQAAAKTLEHLQAAVYCPTFPRPDEWPELIDKLLNLDLATFSKLVNDDAAAQAARIIEAAASI